MRVVVLGGTQVVGRAITQACVAAGYEVVVVHRGEHEPSDPPEVDHVTWSVGRGQRTATRSPPMRLWTCTQETGTVPKLPWPRCPTGSGWLLYLVWMYIARTRGCTPAGKPTWCR